MTPLEEALAAVRAVDGAGVRLVVVGTAALALRGVDLGAPPSDVDALLPHDGDLDVACRVLDGAGFALSVWGERIHPPIDREAIAGKIYVRAVRGGAQIDLMYPPLPAHLEALAWRASRVAGLDVAEPRAIVDALAASDRRKHRALAERLRRRDPTSL